MARLQPVASREFDESPQGQVVSGPDSGSRTAFASDTADNAKLMGMVINVMGYKFKVSTAVSVLAGLCTIGAIIATGLVTWGTNVNRISQLEVTDKAQAQVIDNVKKDLGTLAREQSATRATVDAIKDQQDRDRSHFDGRLDKLFDEVRRSRQQ